jgi:hypothetical protein
MALELIPLATARLRLGEQSIVPGGPFGTRLIAEVAECVYEGERLRAKQKGAASADWALLAPDGTGTLDVRLTLETDDGAIIFVSYRGKLDCSQGLGAAPAYAAPLFETGDERYAWLNRVQAVAKGILDGEHLTYEIYELR